MESISIIDFSKGMNNHIEPGRLGSDTARLVSNARVTTKALVPIHQAKEAVNQNTPEDLGHYGWINRSVVKWFDIFYWSFNDADSDPYYGGNEYPLGIPAPTVNFQVSTSSVPYPHTATYKYCITYSNQDEWESAPQEYDNNIRHRTIFLEEKLANITVGVPTEDWVKTVNIYRTVDGGSTFYQVKSLLPEECGITFVDSFTDEFLPFNEVLETYTMQLPPDGGKYLTERDGYFYLAVGDRLYASLNGNPHYWNLLNWIGFNEDITGVVVEYQGLLVMTANRVYRVGGGDITNAYKQEIPVSQGCVNWRTISVIGNAPIWVSNDGICIWDGQNVITTTLNKIDFDTSATRFAFSANDRYHLFLEDGTCLVFDMRSNNIFYQRTLDYGYGWYDADEDQTYLCDIDPYILYINEGSFLFEEIEYLSALVPGDELVLRSFERAYLDADGLVTLTIYDEFDNEMAVLTSNKIGRSEVLFPSGLNIRGMSVRLQSTKTIRSLIIYYEDIGI